jgi:hypothetical protein
VPHAGPMAQDFKALFYPGRNDKTISTLEFDGIEIASIKALEKRTSDLNARNEKLEKENQDLKARLEKIEEALKQR